MENERSPRINLFVLIYFSLSLSVLFSDYFFTIKYYFPRLSGLLSISSKIGIIVFLGIAIFIFVVFFKVFVRRNINLPQSFQRLIFIPEFTRIDYLAIGIILLLTMLRLPFPDSSYDTLNYHLFLQNPNLKNNITYNFFPSGIQTYSFPLSDHLFYIFRILLGYRGGTLLNTIILIVIYFQVRDFLLDNQNISIFFHNKLDLLGILAFLIISTEFILANIGIYMVDILPIPFLLEILKWATGKKANPKFVLPYIALLAGCAVSLKFLMIIYCIPLLFIALLRDFKSITIKLFISVCFLGVFPLLPYLFYNFTQTNNPIFPYFNNIFNSPYFQHNYWQDERWGPKTVIETILWPILIFFQSDRTSEMLYYSGRLGLGYASCFFLIIEGKMQRNNKGCYLLIFMISTFLWTLNAGYIRYGLFLEIFSGLLIIECIAILAKSSEKIRVAFSGMVCTLLIIQIITAYSYTISNKVDWSLRPTVFNNVNSYIDNFKYIFNDYIQISEANNPPGMMNLIDKVDCWMVLPEDFNSGVVSLVKDDVPIFHLGYIGMTENTYNVFTDINQNYTLYAKNKFIISPRNIQDIAPMLDQIGYRITDVYNISLLNFYGGQQVSMIKIAEKEILMESTRE